jgi:hypothetical protein
MEFIEKLAVARKKQPRSHQGRVVVREGSSATFGRVRAIRASGGSDHLNTEQGAGGAGMAETAQCEKRSVEE